MDELQQANLIAGIDLGGTNIKAAIADSSGKILVSDSVPTRRDQSSEAVLKRCSDLIRDLKKRLDSPASDSPIVCVGVGVPGLVDLETSEAKFLPNFPGHWSGVPIGSALQENLNCKVRIMNDARTATLGELRFGHGRGQAAPSFALFTIGTGIGGGVVLDGKLRLGPIGSAGELGHQTVVPDGPLCGCGNRGCVEAIASGSALIRSAVAIAEKGDAPHLQRRRASQTDEITVGQIVEAIEAGDQPLQEMLDGALDAFGIAVANVVTILHCQLVVLGGGVAELGERILQPVRESVKRRVRMFPTDDIRIEKSLLGSSAGVRGAVALAMDEVTERATE